MKKTLLQEALTRKKISKTDLANIKGEHVELALAWARDEISYADAVYAFDLNRGARGTTTQVYPWLARALKVAIREGTLVETSRELEVRQ